MSCAHAALSIVIPCRDDAEALARTLAHLSGIKRVGRSVLLAEPLHTSGRRFLADGCWRTVTFFARPAVRDAGPSNYSVRVVRFSIVRDSRETSWPPLSPRRMP